MKPEKGLYFRELVEFNFKTVDGARQLLERVMISAIYRPHRGGYKD